jgi:AraC-like DNA-binding protein
MFRPTKITHYLSRMALRGFEAVDILAGSAIDIARLEDPEYLIDVWQAQKVIANMIHLTGNDALGFELGQEIEFSDFGIVGYALMSSRSMRDVINLWSSYCHSLVGVMLRIALEEKPKSWRVTFTEVVPMGSLLRFCVEENLTFGKWIGESVVGHPIRFSSVELAYPAPGHRSLYRKIFGTDHIIFNAPVSAVNVISPPVEVTARDHKNTELFEICQQYCQQVMRQITAERPLALKVRNLFLHSSGQIPNLNEVARTLNLSPRSLRRHLAAEGVTFQQLINEFRCDLSKEYLKSSALTNQEIAFLLGYQDVKAFLRAFRNWTGTTTTEYRKSTDAIPPGVPTAFN